MIILSDEEGRPLGEALVELASEHAQQQAMQSRHKATMGGRYVELYASSQAVFDQVRPTAPHVPSWPQAEAVMFAVLLRRRAAASACKPVRRRRRGAMA